MSNQWQKPELVWIFNRIRRGCHQTVVQNFSNAHANPFLNGAAVDGGGLQVGVLVGDHQVEDVDEVGHEEAAVLKIKNGGLTENLTIQQVRLNDSS